MPCDKIDEKERGCKQMEGQIHFVIHMRTGPQRERERGSDCTQIISAGSSSTTLRQAWSSTLISLFLSPLPISQYISLPSSLSAARSMCSLICCVFVISALSGFCWAGACVYFLGCRCVCSCGCHIGNIGMNWMLLSCTPGAPEWHFICSFSLLLRHESKDGSGACLSLPITYPRRHARVCTCVKWRFRAAILPPFRLKYLH